MEFDYKLLSWDTEHFGYKIASVRPYGLGLNTLKLIVDDLKKNNFKLVYFFIDPSDEISNNSLTNMFGFLADEKITFGLQLDSGITHSNSPFVLQYKLSYPSEKLKLLALQSGTYSRFKIDAKFVNNEYEKLYLEWIDKSVKQVIADEVLVYYRDDDEKGLITLKTIESKGSIGLLAVDENERGNSIGKELMNAAFSSFIKKGIRSIEVVTQKANRIACEYYKALGFEVINTENIYHLWIN